MKKRCIWYLPEQDSFEKPADINLTYYNGVVETIEVLNSPDQNKKKRLNHGK